MIFKLYEKIHTAKDARRGGQNRDNKVACIKKKEAQRTTVRLIHTSSVKYYPSTSQVITPSRFVCTNAIPFFP